MYVKAAEYAKRYQVRPQTLRRWAATGRIDFHRTAGGTRLYKLPDGGDEPACGDRDGGGSGYQKEKVVYARVSSSKQKDDLRRQADYLRAKFADHRLVTDVGSGINWKRKGLLSLLDAAHRGDLEEVVVATRDRLCRFAFELLEHVFRQRGTRLVVIDADSDISPERELSDDLLSIVQIFCCRRNGKRRYAASGRGDGDADATDQAEPDEGAEAEAQRLRTRR